MRTAHAVAPPDESAPRGALRAGFTLIEISIVLVIIGLVVGGILVGQDLIRAGAVRAQLSQIEKYNQAVNTFYGKYSCLPGDCNSAVTWGLGTSGGPGDNGNGDGLIFSASGMFIWGGNTAETFNFWYHLQQAGLISDGPFTGQVGTTGFDTIGDFTGYAPVMKIRSGAFINVGSSNGANLYILASNAPSGSASYNNYALTPLEAYSIDKKIDDGYPYSGNIVFNYPAGNPDPETACCLPAGCNCAVLNKNQYNLTSSQASVVQCGLAVITHW